MAATADKLSLADFERQYGDEKPYHEYWFGEAIPKALPTWQHGLLQKIAMRALDEAGYQSGSEVKLKISSDFEPVPDVIATTDRIEGPYPTKPVNVVVEGPFARRLISARLAEVRTVFLVGNTYRDCPGS